MPFALLLQHHVLRADPCRGYIAGCTLRHLLKGGVEYIYSSLLCDLDALTGGAPAVDPGFVGLGIYGMDVKGEQGTLVR